MVTKELEVETGGAHLPKITKGGAASVICGVGNDQSWASPPASQSSWNRVILCARDRHSEGRNGQERCAAAS